MTQESGNLSEEMAERHHRRTTSLRTRITLATTSLAVLATVAVGYFAFVRNDATQTFLGDQFQNAVRENAENQIQALAYVEAQNINRFFVKIDQDVTSTATYAANLLGEDAAFASTNYWDASLKLSQITGGGWDNPNSDVASIFAPSYFQLTEETLPIANTLSHLDFFVPDIVDEDPNVLAIYFGNRFGYTYYYPNIDLATLVPHDFDPSQRPWYLQAENYTGETVRVIWSDPYLDAAQNGFVVTGSAPILGENNRFYGVIGADIKLDTITEQVLNIRIGSTGYAFLTDRAGNIIAMPDLGYSNFEIPLKEFREGEESKLASLTEGPDNLQPEFEAMMQGESGQALIRIANEEHYLSYVPISSTGYSLGIVVPVFEMNAAYREAQLLVTQENQQTQSFGLLLLAAVVIAAALISFVLSQVLITPLSRLTSTAQQVSAGDLSATAPETSVSEVNVLAEAFNTMTAQLSEMLGGLEARVAERTGEIEEASRESQKRAAQFEAIAQVTHSISASQDIETLLPKITNVISEQFGFYHVGVFLLDASREYAVLRAANSAGGKRMLAREHSLKVGEVGIVGFVTSRGKARIALDTGSDAIYFDNPDLPETRSEMALPVIVREQVIGALDVQSVEPNAFSQDDLNTLSTLADQVGIAIQNARLYQETRAALAQSQALSQQNTLLGWRQFTQTQKLTGIRRSKAKATLLNKPLRMDVAKSDGVMVLPIILRDQTIGELKIESADQRHWTQDEIDIASAIIGRAAIAMENARLVLDSQKRASKEQIIGQISSKIGASINIRSVMQTAVEELGRALPGSEVSIQIRDQDKSGGEK